MTQIATGFGAKINYGSREYWLSYAEDIVNRTKINQPWFSEIRCAEIGIGSAVEERVPKALELSNLLWQKKTKKDYKIYLDK